MRHGKKGNHLGRKRGHRKALLRNLTISLVKHKRIVTTLAKAKALRVFVEPLITKGKNDTTHNRRVVFSYLQNKYAVTDIFGEIATEVGDRPGGYTRIVRMGFRKGDGGEKAMIELVDFNKTYVANAEAKTKTRRSRRGGAKKVDAPAAPTKTTSSDEEE